MNTIDNLPTEKPDMWRMVKETRHHYNEYLKQFFVECERVEQELEK